ncbi:unnamed protein product [Prorocentrum cordatum]|uniref:Uncharacterized protein n=1 Tax=Prorocentrum cordatum TaxID=2364126 RepID=A0ABN9S7K3_9DINO|nr:unnamed protein product [Polarella glacialis]
MSGPWGRLPLFEDPAAPAAGKEAARAPGQFEIGAPGRSGPPAATAEAELEAGCSAAASFATPAPQAGEQDPTQGVFAWSPVVSRAELRRLSTSAELASGPHLRALVVVFCALLWLVVREWLPRFTMIPLVGVLCTSTSALWRVTGAGPEQAAGGSPGGPPRVLFCSSGVIDRMHVPAAKALLCQLGLAGVMRLERLAPAPPGPQAPCRKYSA